MPSEIKTVNLGLNQWKGNEYPKRIDFVNDNDIIDEAIGRLADLETEDKSDLVTAVNEVMEQINNLDVNKADLIDEKIPVNQLPIATQTEAEAGATDLKLMTPLKVRQFFIANGGAGGGIINVVFQSGKKYWSYTAGEDTSTIEIPLEQFNPASDVIEVIDNNLILIKDVNYTLVENTLTLIDYALQANETLHFLITQTTYDYNSLVNKPEIVNDFETGGANKLASAETVKQLFQFASDGKENIATEINAKGVTATAAETFASLANKIKTYLTKIAGTAVAGDVLSDKTFKNSTGNLITGTIPSKGAQTYTPGTANQTIAPGQYISGVQTIQGSANLLPANIKDGVNIFGKVGTYSAGVKQVVSVLMSMQSKRSHAISCVPANTILFDPYPRDDRSYSLSLSATAITISGNEYSGAQAMLIEFEPGVIKSKQEKTIVGNGTSDYTINAVDVSKTVIFAMGNNVYGSNGLRDASFSLTDSSTLSGGTGLGNFGLKLCIVEFF